MDKIDELQFILDQGKKIVFFTGAGVSTESGIPDFRSQNGLYRQKYKYPPERILSHDFFRDYTEEFYKFYKEKMLILDVKPNITHYLIAKYEQLGKSLGVITQNIDGLHYLAGSNNVLELHGSIHRNYCSRCNSFFTPEQLLKMSDFPQCKCGGIIKPDVVLYDEPLDNDIINKTIETIKQADVLVILGTSLSVYPASSFIRFFKGNKLVIINKSSTSYDSLADLLINDSLQNVLSKIDIR